MRRPVSSRRFCLCATIELSELRWRKSGAGFRRRQRPLRSCRMFENPRWERRRQPLGRALRRDPLRRGRRPAGPLPAAPRPRPPHAADRDQLPRQHLRAEAAGVTRSRVALGGAARCKEAYAPGHFVLVDQFIDRTFAREKSFFDTGCVAHVSVADPVSPALADAVEKAARDRGRRASRAAARTS